MKILINNLRVSTCVATLLFFVNYFQLESTLAFDRKFCPCAVHIYVTKSFGIPRDKRNRRRQDFIYHLGTILNLYWNCNACTPEQSHFRYLRKPNLHLDLILFSLHNNFRQQFKNRGKMVAKDWQVTTSSSWKVAMTIFELLRAPSTSWLVQLIIIKW